MKAFLHVNSLMGFVDLVKDAADMGLPAVKEVTKMAFDLPGFRRDGAAARQMFERPNRLFQGVVPAGRSRRFSAANLLIQILQVARGAEGQFNAVCHIGGGCR